MTSQHRILDDDTTPESTNPAYRGLGRVFITRLLQHGNYGPARPFTVGIGDTGAVVIEDDTTHTVTRYDAGTPEAAAFGALLLPGSQHREGGYPSPVLTPPGPTPPPPPPLYLIEWSE